MVVLPNNLFALSYYTIQRSKICKDTNNNSQFNTETQESFFAYSSTKNPMDTSTNGDDSYLSNHDYANVITTTIGGGLSMIGVIFIVISYFKLVEYKAGGTTAQTILLYISIGIIIFYLSTLS